MSEYNPYRDLDLQKKRKQPPVEISSVLALAFKKYRIDKKIARYDFVRYWSEIAGETIASKSYPEMIRDQVLVIRVENSAWAQELSFLKDLIIDQVNKFFKERGICNQPIVDINFYVAGQGLNRSVY